MIEIHARQVIFDDRRNLQEVIESILDEIETLKAAETVETVEETTEEGEINE